MTRTSLGSFRAIEATALPGSLMAMTSSENQKKVMASQLT